MQIEIKNGKVDLSGTPILSDININITTQSKIAVVGRNGGGKTTLLRLLSGELSLSNAEHDGGFMAISGNPVIASLNQMTFLDDSRTLLEEIRSAYTYILNLKQELAKAQQDMENEQSQENIKKYTALLEAFTREGGFYFEREYEAAIKKFGFSEQEKHKPLSQFSGGQRTKIAFLKLLLSKPDLLLLDEPTNHLDLNAVGWLEEYIKNYKKAIVVVSHDRMFLDRTVNEIYEIEHGKTRRYIGNYTEFTKKKREEYALQKKKYEQQQKDIQSITATAERFRYKATKAAMAQSKFKQIEKMDKIEAPENFDERVFRSDLQPQYQSANEVLSLNELSAGYNNSLCSVSFSVYRGEKVGVIGANGLGKSTLLKTLVGKIPALSGSFKFGSMVKWGYFDQQMAQFSGSQTVLDSFMDEFPALTNFEARSALAAFLFSGDDVFKTLDMLSGGERVRLSLCKIFFRKPNLLILDEPTNHMDILSKEALEDILLNFEGTVIFVSHDRYFVNKIAQRLLVFENGNANVYDCSYEEYLLKKPAETEAETPAAPKEKAPKKSYTTPLKEKARREKALKKAEEAVAKAEAEVGRITKEQQLEENLTDYIKLEALSQELAKAEETLLAAMEEWEKVANEQ